MGGERDTDTRVTHASLDNPAQCGVQGRVRGAECSPTMRRSASGSLLNSFRKSSLRCLYVGLSICGGQGDIGAVRNLESRMLPLTLPLPRLTALSLATDLKVLPVQTSPPPASWIFRGYSLPGACKVGFSSWEE